MLLNIQLNDLGKQLLLSQIQKQSKGISSHISLQKGVEFNQLDKLNSLEKNVFFDQLYLAIYP